MNWSLIEREIYAGAQERGRPWPRLIRGTLWAAVALFLVSIFAFWVGHLLLEQALDPWWKCQFYPPC